MARNLAGSLSFQVYHKAQSLDPFFLLYINDLADDLECNPKLFADDVSLNEHIRNTTDSTTCLRRDLNKIGSWGYQ